MSVLKDWFKNKVLAMSIAFSNVEKNLLSQDGKILNDDTKEEKTQHNLLNNLVRGEITKEVRDLRWRTYKILKNLKGMRVNNKYEIDVKPNDLSKVNVDTIDPYSVEMVITNEAETSGVSDTNLAAASAYEYLISLKNDKPIKVTRNFFPKFYVENFATKLNVRRISDTDKLLEFYVSVYPDEYNKTFNLFLKEIKKVVDGTKSPKFLEMDAVGFIQDFLFYEYKVKSFDKIIEYNGSYVIKYLAEITTNGEDILKDFVEEDLDKKYDEKAVRKRRV